MCDYEDQGVLWYNIWEPEPQENCQVVCFDSSLKAQEPWKELGNSGVSSGVRKAKNQEF